MRASVVAASGLQTTRFLHAGRGSEPSGGLLQGH